MSAIAAQEPRLNEEIRTRECRLIGYDGSQMGIFNTREAMRIAEEAGLDLVEIAPNAEPPVCRIMDYGKFKYDQAIKAKQARKEADQGRDQGNEVPVPRSTWVTTPRRRSTCFVSWPGGAKVKITIMFRGREMAHPEQGLSILERLADDLKDVAVIENAPKMEGRNMHMLIAPLPAAVKKAADKDAKNNGESNE